MSRTKSSSRSISASLNDMHVRVSVLQSLHTLSLCSVARRRRALAPTGRAAAPGATGQVTLWRPSSRAMPQISQHSGITRCPGINRLDHQQNLLIIISHSMPTIVASAPRPGWPPP
eukprot:3819236-Rhodomonas_salina.7